MQYRNQIIINDTYDENKYTEDCFNEELSTPDYEVIDIDLAATSISRELVDRLKCQDKMYDCEIDSAVFMAVDEYLNDIRNKLLDSVSELTGNNLECEIIKYRGE